MNQPLIGVFTIPIGDLMVALKKERVEETKTIEEICEKLEEIIRDPGNQVKSYGGNINVTESNFETTDNIEDIDPDLIGSQFSAQDEDQ